MEIPTWRCDGTTANLVRPGQAWTHIVGNSKALENFRFSTSASCKLKIIWSDEGTKPDIKPHSIKGNVHYSLARCTDDCDA